MRMDGVLLKIALPLFNQGGLPQKDAHSREDSSKWVGASSSLQGGSLGLVVMGGDSCSEGRWFESQHHILDEKFSHLFFVNIVSLKRQI